MLHPYLFIQLDGYLFVFSPARTDDFIMQLQKFQVTNNSVVFFSGCSFLKALHRRVLEIENEQSVGIWGEQNPVLRCRTQNKIRQKHMGCWYPIAVAGVCLQSITYIPRDMYKRPYIRVCMCIFKCDWT